MVGRSIASITDLVVHIYLSASHLSKYGTSVIYISYGPLYVPYYRYYTVYGSHCWLIAKILPSEIWNVHAPLGQHFGNQLTLCMCSVQRVHVSHKATQALCVLKHCARKCHIPSNQCRYSNYSLPDVALGQHSTAGRYGRNKVRGLLNLEPLAVGVSQCQLI